MAGELTAERLAAVRSASQLLHRPRSLSHPADIAREICGSQAQDMRHGRLAFRARSATLRAADVERARAEERSLLHTWAMRKTLHLIATDDAPWLLPLLEPTLEAFARARLAQLGLERRAQDRALTRIRRALERDGPSSRTQLHQRIGTRGMPMSQMIRGHLVGLAVATGIACLGPMSGAQTLLVAAGDWLPPRPKHDRDAALAELARRYLRAFGPSTDHDLAKWAGLPLRDVRAGLDAIAGEMREVRVAGGTGLALRRRGRRAGAEAIRLLPAWDTYWMGYRDRAFATPGDRWRKVSDGGGMIAPAVVADGVAVARWRPSKKDEDRASVTQWFTRAGPGLREDVEAEIADVARFERQA